MTQDGEMTTQDWLFIYEQYRTNPSLQQQYPAVWGVAKATHDHYTHQESDVYIPTLFVGLVFFVAICWIVRRWENNKRNNNK